MTTSMSAGSPQSTGNPGGFWSDDNFLSQIIGWAEEKIYSTGPGIYKQGRADWGCES